MNVRVQMAAELMKLDTLIDIGDTGSAFASDFLPAWATGMVAPLAMLQQNPNPMPLFQRGQGECASSNFGRNSGQYDSGTRLLDEHKYDGRLFSASIARHRPASPTAPTALSTGKPTHRTASKTRRSHGAAGLLSSVAITPNSHWLNDAQVLEAEVKQNAGHPVSPADESNEDIKLMAINSLMNADPDRAIPLLEGLLKSNATPRVKDRAMFVLTQNRSARSQQILADYAKGAGNPDLQVRAIRYVGMSGTPEAQQQLASVYAASNDVAVKREIIRSLMVSKGRDVLFTLAKSEKDPSLRAEAIRQLGVMKATDQLVQLYAAESSADNKIQIIRALMVAGASDKLLDLAKNEKDPAVRAEAIRNLAFAHSTTPETLIGLYTADSDPKTKRALIDALHARGDAKPLVDLARKESDPVMKKVIVERLSTMRGSKEATDYMMELLK